MKEALPARLDFFALGNSSRMSVSSSPIKRNDGRRSFIRAEPEVVARIAATCAEFVRVAIHRMKARLRRPRTARSRKAFSRLQKILPVIGRKATSCYACRNHSRPRTVLVKKAHEVMAKRHFLHGLHHKLVVVRRDIGRGKDRRHFHTERAQPRCAWSWTRFHLPEFDIQVLHERGNAVLDRSEILVLELLPLGDGAPKSVFRRRSNRAFS